MELYRRESLNEDTAITMRSIPSGSFLMGSPETEPNSISSERPQHLVEVESFEMSVTSITQAQWAVVAKWPAVNLTLAQDPSVFTGSNRPVERVNWHQALEFCARLSARTNKNYTLPSEAQWEYACRAGTTTPFAFGETITTDLANYDGNYDYGSGPKGRYRKETNEVGSHPANAWGLHDMHGNVWEWCLDQWHDNYVGAPSDGTPWESSKGQRIRLLRGGSWVSGPVQCRSAYRSYNHPAYANRFIGFRVVCLPKNLKSQNDNQQLTKLALTMLDTIERSRVFIPEITGIIRKALLLNA